MSNARIVMRTNDDEIDGHLLTCNGHDLLEWAPSVRDSALILRSAHRLCIQASSFRLLSRSALLITDTELNAIAAPAMMGLNKIPKNG